MEALPEGSRWGKGASRWLYPPPPASTRSMLRLSTSARWLYGARTGQLESARRNRRKEGCFFFVDSTHGQSKHVRLPGLAKQGQVLVLCAVNYSV